MNKRTGFITAGAVVGAIAAGSMAVAANIGILNSADDDSIGNLPAAVPSSTQPLEPQVIDVFLEEPTPSVITVAPTSTSMPDEESDPIQEFAIEDAGIVSIGQTDAGLTLAGVDTADGWESSTDEASADAISVTFARGDVTYLFAATVGSDGAIVASVEQPIVEIVRIPAPPSQQGSTGTVTQTAPPATAAPSVSVPTPVVTTYDDHDDSDDSDDSDDDHDEYEAPEHEEHDEEDELDEHDEYEGAEDDD